MLARLCCTLAALFSTAALATTPTPPSVAAASYVLMDYHTGTVLAEKEPHTRVEPASIVKVMTAYVAFDELRNGHITLEDQVLISEKAWRSQGSRSFVEVGRRVRLEDLLHGIVIQSGNDASIALAEHIAGDETVFAQLMNKHAQRLGMSNTHFTNASGLPDAGMHSTAYDIALLSRALIQDFPEFYPWFKDKEFIYNNIRQVNRNRLLWDDSTVDGIKTGHTNAAGYCLAASAVRDGRRLITVVMGTASPRIRTQASRALLEYGYRFFETAQLLGPQAPLQTSRVYRGAQETVSVGTRAPLAFSLPREASSRLQTRAEVDAALTAPLAAGERVGQVSIVLDGTVLHSEPLVALEAVPVGTLWQQLTDTVRLWLAR